MRLPANTPDADLALPLRAVTASVVGSTRELCSLAIVLLVLGFALPESHAQAPDCGADDRQCLEESLVLACGNDATEASCLGWVQRVEAHDFFGSAEWKLVAALGHAQVVRFLDSDEEEERHEERARAILRDLLSMWPDGYHASQAYIGLAGLTEDLDQSIQLQRNAMRADPGNEYIPYFLAGTLARRGRDDDLREAAELYRSTYSARGGWYYAAGNALGLYRTTGQTDEEQAFRAEIARDSGMDGFGAEVASESFVRDLERAAEVLAIACRTYVIGIFGSDTCADGIDTLVAATRSTGSLGTRRAIADVAVEGMRLLTVSGDGPVEEQAQRRYKFGTILQEWIATDAATAAVHVLWAQHAESGLDESVVAFENAVELEPGNGRYRYWLAAGYIAQGRYDEAIEQLTVARGTLPENVGLTPGSVDRQIRRAESLRARSR